MQAVMLKLTRHIALLSKINLKGLNYLNLSLLSNSIFSFHSKPTV